MIGTTRELAQAVADRINGYSFTVDLAATRGYAPTLDQEDIGDALACYVVPIGRSAPPGTEDPAIMGQLGRGHKLRYYDVDVVVTTRTDTGDLDTVDALADLMDEVGDLFEGNPLTGLSGRQVRCTAAEPVVVDPDDFHRGQFTSMLRLTFRVIE